MTDDLRECPFCGEDGLDLIGLKFHLINYCEEYDNVLPPEPITRIDKRKEK